MYKLSKANKNRINNRFRWQISSDYNVRINLVNYNEEIHEYKVLKEYFDSQEVKSLAFFGIYNRSQMIGFIVHGTNRVNLKTTGKVFVCYFCLNEYLIDEIGTTSELEKADDTIKIIKGYMEKKWGPGVDKEGWLRIYNKADINKAQIRTISLRLKERRIQRLLEENKKLTEVLKIANEMAGIIQLKVNNVL